MIVENATTATRELSGRLGDEDGERFTVEFDRPVPADADPADEDAPDPEARRARVDADLGEYLADAYDDVTIHKDERESGESGSDADESEPPEVAN